MKAKLLLLSCLMLFFNINSINAGYDYDLYASLHCANLFRHYERKYKLPTDTLHAIALKESGKYHTKHKINIVWPWAVRAEGKSYYFSSKKEAVIFIKRQLKKGNTNIDVGCMQINLKYHPDSFASIEHALEPRYNIEKAAKILSHKFSCSRNWSRAVANYHSTRKEKGRRYFAEVYKIADYLDEYRLRLKNIINQQYSWYERMKMPSQSLQVKRVISPNRQSTSQYIGRKQNIQPLIVYSK